MNPKIFFGELKRRNVYKVGVAYAVVAWLLIQVATQVFPFLDIPTWMIRLIIIMSALGFPIALIIAWAFELTPEGIKRTEDADAARQRSRGGVWIAVIVAAAALSLGPFFLGRYTAGRATSRPVTQPEARPGFQSEAPTMCRGSTEQGAYNGGKRNFRSFSPSSWFPDLKSLFEV